ncbi:platelet-derived growth factor receptor alpha-like [Lingula anatina]|uniref:Platelet-derived growth factor receptor alpha-like n=1 Tax=Lingula anatina TaxID=7574 RepID=A0A1S3J8U3_LINAN|nr:platelet-derived growth factor receptor alpha-like [Lingula anatina]|eukprot:XP_013406289.1 platelet-derived growth factor receptor alpha-like [Lingula anatina]
MGVVRMVDVVLFLFFVWTWGTVDSQMEQGVELGRCRTRCLEFLKLEVNDEECMKDGNCKMCWETCEYLQWEPHTWDYMCNAPHICFPGCKSSCAFWENHSAVKAATAHHELVKPVQVTYNKGTLRLEWMPPNLGQTSGHVIYILNSRDAGHNFEDWYTDIQTADTWVEYEMNWFPYFKFQFQLLVVSENGIVAISETRILDISQLNALPSLPSVQDVPTSTTFTSADSLRTTAATTLPPSPTSAPLSSPSTTAKQTDLPSTTLAPTGHPSTTAPTTGQPSTTTAPSATPRVPAALVDPMNISVTAGRNGSTIYVFVHWQQTSAEPTDYSIFWGLESCNGCTASTSDYYVTHVTDVMEEHTEVRLIAEWTFNSKYWLQIERRSTGSFSPRISFYTPECENTDSTSTVCLQSKDEDEKDYNADHVRTEETKPSHVIVVICVAVSVVVVIVNVIICIRCHWKRTRVIERRARAMGRNNSYNGPGLYSDDQLVSVQDKWELDPICLTFGHQLGHGAFGKVLVGSCDGKKVAIKMVKSNAPSSYKADLLAKISLMKKIGNHPNIVSMIGSCTLRQPVALVMEYMPHRDLQHFLRLCRFEGQLTMADPKHKVIEYPRVNEDGSIEQDTLTAKQLLSFAHQIALAMEYLSSKGFVHRDLAARNVLVGADKVVKLSNFGLSRDANNDLEYSNNPARKWMSPESLKDRTHNAQSDVWTFGILLWEIVTFGATPYPDIAVTELATKLDQGTRLKNPKNCSTELYILMLQCWHKLPEKRPSFTSIRLELEDMMSQNCDFLELENLVEPISEEERSGPVPDSTFEKTEVLKTREDEETEEVDEREEEDYVQEPPFTKKRSLKKTLSQLSNILDSTKLSKKCSVNSRKSAGSSVSSSRLSMKGSIRRKSDKHQRSLENLIVDEILESGSESSSETQLDVLNEEVF